MKPRTKTSAGRWSSFPLSSIVSVDWGTLVLADTSPREAPRSSRACRNHRPKLSRSVKSSWPPAPPLSIDIPAIRIPLLDHLRIAFALRGQAASRGEIRAATKQFSRAPGILPALVHQAAQQKRLLNWARRRRNHGVQLFGCAIVFATIDVNLGQAIAAHAESGRPCRRLVQLFPGAF